MNVLLFGATGMVGQGVLRECLLDPDIEVVQTLGRTAAGVTHPKLREIVRADLGVSSAGMSESQYERITYDIAIAVGQTLSRLNPGMTFIYVSGAGTDSSEKGRVMWARVKGKIENALLRLSFKAPYMFRPGVIQPMHGERSKTPAYRIGYSLVKPLLPLLRRLFPNYVLTTEEIGRAMIQAAARGYPKRILESTDIRDCARPGA
jgi:uncharacterized protein YbjT (DUF2867 family)